MLSLREGEYGLEKHVPQAEGIAMRADVTLCVSESNVLRVSQVIRGPAAVSASRLTDCSGGRDGAFVVQYGFRCMPADRLTALLCAVQAGIHLALADDLTVAGLEYEVVLAVA